MSYRSVGGTVTTGSCCTCNTNCDTDYNPDYNARADANTKSDQAIDDIYPYSYIRVSVGVVGVVVVVVVVVGGCLTTLWSVVRCFLIEFLSCSHTPL